MKRRYKEEKGGRVKEREYSGRVTKEGKEQEAVMKGRGGGRGARTLRLI